MRKLLTIVIMVLLALPLSAQDVYYVDGTNGNDAWSGEYDAPTNGDGPWETITQANNTLTAGDIVYIRTGTYSTNDGGAIINPDNSGSSGNYITYENYTGEEPNLANVYLGAYVQRAYIKIKGLKMDNGSQSTNMELFVRLTAAGDYCVVEDCTFKYLYCDGAGTTWDKGIWGPDGADYLHVKNCSIEYVGEPQPPASSDKGDGIFLESMDYALIEDCFIDFCGHSSIAVSEDTSNYVIRNNTFRGQWGKTINPNAGAIGVEGVIEGNTFYDSQRVDDAPWSIPNMGLQMSVRNVIFRRNLIYDTDGPGLLYVASGDVYFVGNRLYHNVIYNAGRQQYTKWGQQLDGPIAGFTSSGFYSDIDYRNNIFYNCNWDGFENLMENAVAENNTTMNYNHWENDTADWWDGANDSYGDPLFVNPTTDFSLQSGSGCIDTGTWLTQTNDVGGGSGTSMVVDDARFFTDGYGLVTGDVIQLSGQTVTAIVTAVNYGTDTLTLDTSLTWDDNHGVALAYNGSAPDKGAYESIGIGGSMEIKPGTKLLIKPGAGVIIKEQ